MENREKKGGFFEQIQGNINPVVLKYYYGPKMKESDTSFPYLVRVMKAHVIMLKEQSIIPEEAARRLLCVMEGWGRDSGAGPFSGGLVYQPGTPDHFGGRGGYM